MEQQADRTTGLTNRLEEGHSLARKNTEACHGGTPLLMVNGRGDRPAQLSSNLPLASSPSSSSSCGSTAGMLFVPSSQRPRSINLHFSLQNGNRGQSLIDPSSRRPQVGQVNPF